MDQPGEAHARLPDPASTPTLMTLRPDTEPGTPYDIADRPHQNEIRETQPNMVPSDRGRLNLATRSHTVVNHGRLDRPKYGRSRPRTSLANSSLDVNIRPHKT